MNITLQAYMKMNHKERKRAKWRLKKRAKKATRDGDHHLTSHLVKLILVLRGINFPCNGIRQAPWNSFRGYARVRPQVARLTVDDYTIRRFMRYMSFTNAVEYFEFYFCKPPVLATGTSLTHSDEHFKRTWLGRSRGGKHRNTDVKADVNAYVETVEAPTPKPPGIMGKIKNVFRRKK